MRDFNIVTPTIRADRLAGRLFVPVLVLVALALAYSLASSVVPAIRGRVDAVLAADTTGLVR